MKLSFDLENIKKPPEKLHTCGSWEFFFSAAPTAQNSPELHFRFMNSFIQPSRVESLCTTDKYVVGIVKIGTWNWFWSIRRGYRKVLQFITIFSLHVIDWQMQDRMKPCQNPDKYIVAFLIFNASSKKLSQLWNFHFWQIFYALLIVKKISARIE